MNVVSVHRVRDLLGYDPETGLLRWKTARGTKKAGAIAGWIGKDRYWHVGIDGDIYMAHRIIWLLVTGSWPEPECEHEDRDGTNNRWSNLREATHSQNLFNIRVRPDSRSQVKGVKQLPSGRWFAGIQVRGRRISLGTRDTKEEAAFLYAEAAQRHAGEFARIE